MLPVFSFMEERSGKGLKQTIAKVDRLASDSPVSKAFGNMIITALSSSHLFLSKGSETLRVSDRRE